MDMSQDAKDGMWPILNEWMMVERVSELTKDQYQIELHKARQKLEEVMDNNFARRYFTLMTCLSVKAQLKIENLTQPFALFLIANPGTKKSTVLDIVNATSGCYRSDKFTAKSWVSHSATSNKKDLSSVDLLPRIQYKTFITPELAPIFSADKDNLIDVFGIMTRILDGRGLTTDSGVHGQRGYIGDYYFMS